MSKTSDIYIGKTKVHVKVADNILSQMKGLSFQRHLKKNDGALLDFGSDTYPGITTITMLFSMDIIWIDSNYRIVHIKRNAKPGRFWRIHMPKQKARYVLEVNSGFSDNNKIKVGQIVKIK